MANQLAAPERGCLLLADITGYTSYLQGTELEHAQDVLADLLETIVESIEPVFILSKLEGDAAFAYAPTTSLSPTMVMDTVEVAYFAFQQRLRDITHSTTCDCNACVLIPSLDLKFLLHEGEYVIRRISRSEELTGSDVVLVHRLLKGTAAEAVDSPAYAAYTAGALAAMSMNPSILGFVAHTEHFDDIGDVEIFIQDLSARWAFEQERNRELVTEDEASLVRTMETPFPASLIWEYLTDPSKRMLWQEGLTGIDMITEGRRGIGSVNHCMHGPDKVIEHIADWRPFSYLTTEYADDSGQAGLRVTTLLDPTDEGTRVTLRVSAPAPMWKLIGDEYAESMSRSGERLAEALGKEMASGNTPA